MLKTKRFLISGLLILSTITPAFAENSNEASENLSSRVFRRLILEGSVLNTGYQGVDSPSYSDPNGYSVGALLDLLGSGKLVLETGALYRQLGTTDNLGETAYTARYLSVPVTAKYYFRSQERSSLYAKAGLMGSTLLSESTAFPSPTRQIGSRQWEVALLGGLGYKFNLGTSTDFILETDYARASDSVLPGTSIYRADLSASLGLALNL